MTALHVAAINGNIQVIEALVAHGADLSATDSRLLTPYLVALDDDEPHAAQRLLERMTAQENQERGLQAKDSMVSTDNRTMGEALLAYAGIELVHMIQKLLNNGANANARSWNCITPVMLAASGSHLAALDLLKEQGADFAAKNIHGDTALHFACLGPQSGVIPDLLDLGFNSTDSDLHGLTPLYYYAMGTFSKSLQKVVMAHATPVQLSSSQRARLLLLGSQNKDQAILEWPLSTMNTAEKKDAINNISYEHSSFALQNAAFQGSVEMLDMLLDAGAEIDLRSEKISSPLACAATMGRMKAVQLLAKRGARLKLIMPDGTKQSATHAAKNLPQDPTVARQFLPRQRARIRI